MEQNKKHGNASEKAKAKEKAAGKRTLRQDFALVLRAIKIWDSIVPGMWFSRCLYTLVADLSPFFGLYMSAALVNELAGNCELERLLILAAITVGGGFLLSLLKRWLQGVQDLKMNNIWNKHEGFMVDVQNRLQYEYLEDPDVILKRSDIFATFNAVGGGLFRVFWSVPGLLSDILKMVFSVSLTVSIFGMAAEGEFTGIWGFINSPASALVIIALVLLDAIFTLKIYSIRTLKTREAVNGLAGDNVRLGAYGNLWGPDMVVFDMHRIVLEQFRKYNLRPKWVEKSNKVAKKYDSLTIVLEVLLNIVIFLFTAAKAFIGVFGIGNFILYQGTISKFVDSVTGLAENIGMLRHNNQYLEQLYEFMDMPNNMYKGTLIVEKREDIDYEIEFRDVSFKYPRSENWALRHVNLKFKIGDKLAIVGENGSGKTTFIKLLCRLYDPTEGKILLNGIDITRYRYEEYMALFSVVFQDYFLFGFPLGENVAACTDYDEAKVRDCLIRAGLGEKLAAWNGDSNILECTLGKDYDAEGIDLSGGERQKVALARALYKDAPFVILDEPTAALDPIAEAAVYENFNSLVKEKTAVFISHRLSSCRFCHSIAVFDKGELVQHGSHEELVADEDNKYSQLWNAQAKYYRESGVAVTG